MIRIDATGHLEIKGTLSVNGVNAPGTHGGGGSGGSIWIHCRTFDGTGTGLLRANGGNGNNQGGAGAGGRIALHYQPQAQENLPEPMPPVRFSGQPGARGGNVVTVFPAAMATLYLPDTQFISETISDQRFWYVRPVISGFTEWEPAELTLNNAVIGLPEGFRLTVTGDLTLRTNAQLHVFAAPVTDPLTEDGAAVGIGGDLSLSDNAWILPYASDTNGASVGFHVNGDLTIEDGSGFDADDRGFRWQHGPGQEVARFSDLVSGLVLNNTYSGAGYGGGGGEGFSGASGAAYGTPHAPRLAGSGNRLTNTGGSRGGGAIRIVVDGHAQIDGLLTACGYRVRANNAGGASGGAVWLTCRTLGGASTGLIRVQGASAGTNAGGGGGGRIAVIYDSDAQSAHPVPGIVFDAAPGSSGSNTSRFVADPGTLFFPDSLFLKAMMEAGQFQSLWLHLPGQPHVLIPGSLTVGAGRFTLPAGIHLEIAGDLTLADGAHLTLQAASTNTASDFFGARLSVDGNLNIQDGGWLYPVADWTNGATVGMRVRGNVTVESGGGINANGGGYAAVTGNLSGPGAGQADYHGGGYGGKGGGAQGGIVYGLEAMPLQPGSPGGLRPFTSYLSGRAGGAITLMCGGKIRVDGELLANADPPRSCAGSSGGAIFLVCRRLAGNGLLQANGRPHSNRSPGDGAGGRIAAWVGVGLPFETIEARMVSGNPGGLRWVDDYPYFDQATQMEALAGGGEAGDGSTRLYAILGTLLMMR